MTKQNTYFLNVSTLLTKARLQKGFATLRELYRVKDPKVDYQTWLHAESGRRIPTAKMVSKIAEILEIDRENLILAYCMDKFDDPLSHQVLESFQYKKYLNADTLIDAKEHDRTADYVFIDEQMKAIQADVRLRLYLNNTYDKNLNTNFSRLATYFRVSKDEVKEVVEKLYAIGLVEVVGEEVKKIHRHTTIPNTADSYQVRAQSLLKSLELNLKPASHMTNFHVNLSGKSYKKILTIFEFIEATLIKMEKEDTDAGDIRRFQIALAGSQVDQGSGHDNETRERLGR